MKKATTPKLRLHKTVINNMQIAEQMRLRGGATRVSQCNPDDETCLYTCDQQTCVFSACGETCVFSCYDTCLSCGNTCIWTTPCFSCGC